MCSVIAVVLLGACEEKRKSSELAWLLAGRADARTIASPATRVHLPNATVAARYQIYCHGGNKESPPTNPPGRFRAHGGFSEGPADATPALPRGGRTGDPRGSGDAPPRAAAPCRQRERDHGGD